MALWRTAKCNNIVFVVCTLLFDNHTRQNTALHRCQNYWCVTQQQMLITQNSENEYTKFFTAHCWLCSANSLKKRLVNKWKVVMFAHIIILLYLLPLSIVPENACKSTEHINYFSACCSSANHRRCDCYLLQKWKVLMFLQLYAYSTDICFFYSVIETNNHHFSRSEDPREMLSQLRFVAFLTIDQLTFNTCCVIYYLL